MKLNPILIAIFTLSAAACAFACTCAQRSPREKFDGAEKVFIGVVQEVSDEVVRLKVEKAYKGAPLETVALDGHGTNTCDYLFEKGHKYLVYADKRKHSRVELLMTEVCMGTLAFERESKEVAEDIKFLESPPENKWPSSLKPPSAVRRGKARKPKGRRH